MKYVGLLLLAGGVLHLGYTVDRTEAGSLLLGWIPAFLGYSLAVSGEEYAGRKGRKIYWFLWAGILLRLALVFPFPLLSDDVYRFLWDGYLIVDGQNPFAELPGYYLEAGRSVPGLTPELYANLNSPEYYTIYPPVAQAVFTAAVWLSPTSHAGAAILMKLFLFACELGTLWGLHRLLTSTRSPFATERSGIPVHHLLFYWLNPLVIVEITGNLHFEGAMVFFLVLALWLLVRSRWVAAGATFALSVASKLLPLMLLPFLLRRFFSPRRGDLPQRFNVFLRFSLSLGLSLLLLFLPLLLSGFLDGFGSSLDLYFRKCEFNASLYYLAREVGYAVVGWNIIATLGPALAKTAAAGLLLFALLNRQDDWRSLPTLWLLAFTLYLLCATTVHPWYLSVPIVLSVFSHFRYALVWSAVIPLTYASYATVPYVENLWLVGIEYAVVIGLLVYEIYKKPLRGIRTRGVNA